MPDTIYGFSDKMRQLRKKRQLSQRQLAQKLGIAKSTVSKFENDISYPSADILLEMCIIFDIKSDYLLGLDNKEWISVDGLNKVQKDAIQNMVNSLKNKSEK